MNLMTEQDISEAFEQIIRGKVKRYTHDLRHNGITWDRLFTAQLQTLGYHKTLVQDVEIQTEERAPGFCIQDGVAMFGWVRWEKFREGIFRKFWGSLELNSKGDWRFQVPAGSKNTIYCNQTTVYTNDVNLPQGF